MKKIFLIIFAFIFVACGQINGSLNWEKYEFYELKFDDSDEVYYFRYPSGAEVVQNGYDGYVVLNDCKVEFSKGMYKDAPENVEVKERVVEGNKYMSWFEGGKLVLYAGHVDESDYVFVSYMEGNDVTNCVDLVDDLVGSFTSEPIYFNNKFSYKVPLLSDFKVEYLPSGDGIVMKKWNEEDSYKVEITIYAFENILNKESILDYVAEKYAGYSSSFVTTNGGLPGVYVDEGAGNDAIRHFFVMSEDGDKIYEAILTTPSFYYSRHKQGFDDWTKTIEIF